MKKCLSLVFVLALALTMMMPTFAAGGPSVTTSQSGNNVTITVTDGSETFVSTVTFAKNTTQTYDVSGYGVEIIYNGSKVKSAAVVSVPVAEETAAEEASGPVVAVNYKADRVQLEWMRSSEDYNDAYTRPIVTGIDAFTYNDVMSATPLRYFQTEATKSKALDRVSAGKEYVYAADGMITGSQYIWDGGNFFTKYREINGNVSYKWASWEHFGTNGYARSFGGNYSIRRFTSYFDLNQELYNQMEAAFLAPEDELGKMSYLFPINDTLFVFVNGTLAYWGGTDIKEGENQYGALVRSSFMNQNGVPVRNGVNEEFKEIYPHTDGWCIDLEQYKDETNILSLLTAGENRIDVITDDYWEGGGMNKLQLFVENKEVEKVAATGLNWNNGNTSNKDGANGAGLISFSVDGVKLKNNRNYVTPANFEAAIAKSATSKALFTVLERTVLNNGVYVKTYDVKVALPNGSSWKVYAGNIIVDNPGGNNDRQIIDLYRVN